MYVANRPTVGIDSLGHWGHVPAPSRKREPPCNWRSIAGDSKVFNDYQKYAVVGFVRIRNESGKIEKPFVNTEVDYEILTSVKLSIKLIGTGPTGEPDDSDIFIGESLRWTVPAAHQIVVGALNWETGGSIDLAGVACRKLERCARKCEKCPEKGKRRVGCAFSGDVGWFGSNRGKSQWVYGVLSAASWQLYYRCSLFAPGSYIVSDSGSSVAIQPKPLECKENDVPACEACPTIKRCSPRDPEW